MVPGEGIEPPTFGLQNGCSPADECRFVSDQHGRWAALATVRRGSRSRRRTSRRPGRRPGLTALPPLELSDRSPLIGGAVDHLDGAVDRGDSVGHQCCSSASRLDICGTRYALAECPVSTRAACASWLSY